jgi:hypothetical protein
MCWGESIIVTRVGGETALFSSALLRVLVLFEKLSSNFKKALTPRFSA